LGWAVAAGHRGARADVYVVSGASGGPSSLYAFAGALWTPFGRLDEPGPLIRGWSKVSLFSYHTDLPGDPDQRIDVAGAGIEAEGGWQWVLLGARLALLGGVAWRDYELSPPDPGSSLQGSAVGWSLAFDGDLPIWDRLGVMANGRYAFMLDEYWAEARPYYRFDGGLRTGATLAVAGGEDYLKLRAGAFITGYEFRFGQGRRFFVGGKAGAEIDLDDGDIAPFLGLHLGFFY
jgi:hypothetical protein